MLQCRACSSTSINTLPTSIAPFVAERLLDGLTTAEMHECKICGLLWVSVTPTDEQLGRYYNNYWQDEYITHREKHEPGLKERHPYLLKPRGLVHDTETFINYQPTRVLDIGGGSGIETPFRCAASVDIIDVAHRSPAPGIRYVTQPGGEYDLVVLAHILEHVPNPQTILSYARDASMKCVYIEVPDEASTYGSKPRLQNVATARIAWHEHLNYYDATSIIALITECSMRTIKLERFEWSGGPILRVLAEKP